MSHQPVEETIMDEFIENSARTLDGFHLQVGQLLGRGGTAVVYKGKYREVPVAIKALIPGADEIVREYFLSESLNLRRIRTHWQQYWPNFPLPIPDLKADETGGSQPFIVMEMIDGRPLEELGSKGMAITEADAIQLAVQFGRLLVLLHEGMNKCYADVKYDNFYLLNARNPNNEPQLKVLDWNVLSDRTDEQVARDLFYASLFLFRLLTNTAVQYHGIRLQTNLKTLDVFQKLSNATQRFLLLALHQNQARRFQTAREWMDRLCTLNEWWQKDPLELNDMAAAYLKRSKEEQEGQRLTQAAEWMNDASDLLNISERKGHGDRNYWTALKGRVESGLKETSELEIGKTMLAGKMFDKAVETFKRGAELSPLEPERILRWYWLAQSAQKMGLTDYLHFETDETGTTTRNRLEIGVETLLAGDTLKAEEVFQQACMELGDHVPTGVQALYHEARIYNLATQANKSQQAGDYTGAAETLKTAYDLYRTLPKEPRTQWVVGLGDVYQLWQSAIHDADTLGLARKYLSSAKEALIAQDWPHAAAQFQSALLASEDSHETVRAWQKAVEDCFVTANLDAVLVLSGKAFGLRGIKDSVMPIREMALEIQAMRRAAASARLEEAIKLAQAYTKRHIGSEIALGEAYQRALEDMANAALQYDEIMLAHQTIQLIDAVDSTRAETMTSKLKAQVKQKQEVHEAVIQQILDEINAAHRRDTLKDSSEAVAGIDRIQAIAHPDDPRKNDWEKLFQEIRDRHAHLLEEYQSIKQANQEKLNDYCLALERIDARLEEREAFYANLNPTQVADIELRHMLEKSRAALIGEALNILFQWKQIIPEDAHREELEAKYITYMNNLGPAAWEAYCNQFNGVLNAAREAYNNGDLAPADYFLNTYGKIIPEPFQNTQLRKQVDSTRSFIAWMSTFEDQQLDPLRESANLKSWVNAHIPAPFWRNYSQPLTSALEQRSHDILHKIMKLLDKDPAFASNLNLLVRTRDMLKTVHAKAGEAHAPTQSLGNVVAAARKLRHAGSKQKNDFLNMVDGLSPLRSEDDIHDEIAAQKRRRTIVLAGGGVTIGLILLATLGWLFFRFIGWPLNPTSTPTASNTPTIVPDTATVTPMPSATPEPTAPPSPTPIPTSQFGLVDLTLLGANPPSGVFPLYVIDDNQAIFEPSDGYWQAVLPDQLGEAYNASLHTALNKPTDRAAITWHMDQPVKRDGLYEIFVSSSWTSSNTYPDPLTYEVYLGNQPIQPVAGHATLKLDPGSPANLMWNSLGIYRLYSDQLFSLRLVLTGMDISANRVVKVDAVMIASLAEADPQIPIVQNIQLEGQEELITWADDSIVKFNPEQGWQLNPPNPGNWNGEVQIDLAPTQGKASLTWTLPRALTGPGKYLLEAWISPSLTAKATFTVKVNNQAMAAIPAFVVDPVSMAGTRQIIGVLDVKESDKPAVVEIMLAPEANVVEGILAGDVVLATVQK